MAPARDAVSRGKSYIRTVVTAGWKDSLGIGGR